jgi:hypothetical protein
VVVTRKINYGKSIFLLFTLITFCACSKKENIENPAADAADAPRIEAISPLPTPVALIETGVKPLWIEFQADSILPLSSPDAATLKPFTPWPLSEYVVDMIQWNDGLAIAVNRSGFWFAKKRNDSIIELYFLPDKELVPLYTIHRAFIFQNRPAFLLYSDNFFIEQDVLPPVSRVFAIKDDISGLEPIEIPAFSGFSSADGWDIETLFDIPGDLWYFKAVLKSAGTGKVNYVKAAGLSGSGKEISFGEYMDTARAVAKVKYSRQEAGAELDEEAYGAEYGLPQLPENFTYTAIMRIGDVSVAAWEERDNWNIGAAGLLFLRNISPSTF